MTQGIVASVGQEARPNSFRDEPMSPVSSLSLPRWFASLLMGITVAGCASPASKPVPETPAAANPGTGSPENHPNAKTPPAATNPGLSDPAALLAAQTTEYSRAIEAALAARPVPPSRATPDPVPSTPFTVVDEFRLDSPAGGRSPSPSSPTQRSTPAASPTLMGANRPIEVPGEDAPSGVERSAPPAPAVSAPPSAEPAVRAGPTLERQVQQRVRDYPQDVSAHLDYQLLLFLRDEPVPNLSAMSPLPAEDRELITALMDGMSNFRNAVRADANMLMSRKVRPLVEMADRLRSRSDLGIPTLALCRKVEGFGRYEPIEPARFIAGKAQPVIIYCEVENFSSQLNDGKMWETRLSQDAVLYTEGGLPVWSIKTETFSDLARNRRRDFFVVKLVTLPDNLVIGRYLLKVTIIDQQANRVAEASLPLQVVAR